MNTPKLTERFEAALVYAHQLHRHQTRKVNRTPYIAHLLSVTALVLEEKMEVTKTKRSQLSFMMPWV
jgi:(p)ppGpp synthase/HD superfamily hydrolase